MLWPVALSFGAKSIDIMVTGMYYLSGGYLPGGNYVQIIFARLLFSTRQDLENLPGFCLPILGWQ